MGRGSWVAGRGSRVAKARSGCVRSHALNCLIVPRTSPAYTLGISLQLFSAMARGSKTNRLFQHCADVLGSDPAFLDLISVATTNEALQAVSNSLTACLKDAGAPKSLLDPSKLVNNFIAFCNNPLCHENTVSQQLLQALKDRRNLKTTMQEQQRLFVFQAGLNWKSPFQAIRRQQLLDTIPTFVVIDLGVGAIYPPPGHWIAENKTIFNMWDSHLRNCKMKDKRTPRLPIHELDVEKLMHDLLPGQSAIFRDEEGTSSIPCFFQPSTNVHFKANWLGSLFGISASTLRSCISSIW